MTLLIQEVAFDLIEAVIEVFWGRALRRPLPSQAVANN